MSSAQSRSFGISKSIVLILVLAAGKSRVTQLSILTVGSPELFSYHSVRHISVHSPISLFVQRC